MGKRLAKGADGSNRFWTGVGIYVAVALALIGTGLALFWNFLSAYEASRPRNTVDHYMEQLDAQHVLEVAGEELMGQLDSHLRNEEMCKAQILAALEGKFACARNISRSTDTTQVYALRLGSRTVGSFQMEQVGESHWNFTPWEVTGEEFDLSFLLGETVDVVVPDVYTVLVNGIPLPRACVVEEIPYDEFAEIADSYDLPVMLRYEAGPLLEGLTVTMLDQDGQPTDMEFDPMAVLDNCTGAEREDFEKTVRAFITAYVNYTSRNISDLDVALANLKELMIPDGEMDQRMTRAQTSLSWIPRTQTAKIADLRIDLLSRLDEDLYFCDVTFTVDAHNPYGNVHSVTRSKVVFRQVEGKLLAESMIIF